MATFKDAQALVHHTSKQLSDIRAEYDKSLAAREVAPSLLIEIKNLCENLRSALDFIAVHIHQSYCTPSKGNEKVYFPYAAVQKTQADFTSALRQKFAGLEQAKHDVFEQLVQSQHFGNKGYAWLPLFMELTNENKHQRLVPQTRTEHKELRISNGGTGISLGHGAGIVLGSGASISIGGAVIHGGQTVSADRLPNMTGGNAEIITWVSFNFESNNQPVLPFLTKVCAGVHEIVNTAQTLTASGQ